MCFPAIKSYRCDIAEGEDISWVNHGFGSVKAICNLLGYGRKHTEPEI